MLSEPIWQVALLTLAAAILRCLFLGSKSLWLDEGFTAERTGKTLGQLFGLLLHGEANMALYYLVIYWWQQVAGATEAALRFPSAVFATATVPLIYLLGARLSGRRAGLIAAALLTFNATGVYYAQDARSYALLVMLVTLSTILFLRALERSTLGRCATYAAVTALCPYTHLFGILILPAQFVGLFLFRADRKTVIRLTACMVVAGVAGLLPIYSAVSHGTGQVGWIHPTSRWSVPNLLWEFSGVFGHVNGSGLVLASLYVAAALMALRGPRRELGAVAFLWISLAIPVMVIVIVSLRQPIFVPRYFLICMPFFVMLAAIGMAQVEPGGIALAALGGVVALSLVENCRYYLAEPRQDWRAAISYVTANAKPGDLLLVYPALNLNPVNYYLRRADSSGDLRVIAFAPGANMMNRNRDFLGSEHFLHKGDLNGAARGWLIADRGRQIDSALTMLQGHRVAPAQKLPGVVLYRFD